MTKRDDDAADLADRIAAVDDGLYEIDERLEALAKGELSPSELAALSVEARERPSLDKAVHVMRPLDDTMRSRLLAAARETYFEGSLHADTENRRPRRRAWWKWAAPTAPVLVAALAMAWIRPGAPGRAESVPAYQVEWRSGELATRSGGTAPRARFTAGSALEIWMRVRTNGSRPVQA